MTPGAIRGSEKNEMSTSNQKSKIVLVVDDDQDMREVLKTAVANAGYEVLSADDGDVALDLFQQHQPALVISDIYMPRVDGVSLMRDIRSLNPNAPVILITGYTHVSKFPEEKSSRPSALLRKPFALRDLLQTIDEVLV